MKGRRFWVAISHITIFGPIRCSFGLSGLKEYSKSEPALIRAQALVSKQILLPVQLCLIKTELFPTGVSQLVPGYFLPTGFSRLVPGYFSFQLNSRLVPGLTPACMSFNI